MKQHYLCKSIFYEIGNWCSNISCYTFLMFFIEAVYLPCVHGNMFIFVDVTVDYSGIPPVVNAVE